MLAQLIELYKEVLQEHRMMLLGLEDKGIQNFNHMESEEYGVIMGKIEMLEDILPKLETL